VSAENPPYPMHLRPVPDSGGSAAPAMPGPEEGGTPGLTPPRQRGHSRGFITDVLVELGYVTAETVATAVEASRTAGRPPEALLVEQGEITTDQLSRATAERYGLDHVDLSVYNVDVAAAALFPVTMARRYKAVPVGFVDQKTLLVAAVDPANVLAADDIQIATGLDCHIAVAAEDDVEALLSRLNTLQNAAADAIVEDQHGLEAEEEEEALAEVSSMQAGAEDAPVIKLVYSILAQAVGEGASDIHLEPGEDELRVRFRIDGVLKESAHVPKRMIGAVISRLKIMSELDIAEKRVPQDGRISVSVEERRVDLRVTTLPTHGRLRTRPLRGLLPPGLRRRAGHRADRLGQEHDALRGPG
jgi:type IV pilus assembly protein PilB